MSLRPPPITNLIATLVAETNAGHVHWEPADFMERSFIARRSSGSVVIRGGMPGIEVLEILDSKGNVVERFGSPSTASGGLDAMAARQQLSNLYQGILIQRQKRTQVIDDLVREFQSRHD